MGKSHTMENVYVVNCNAFPDSPNLPMMYGSVEIFSFEAINTYAQRSGECLEDMGSMLGMWGEDYYMTHCLDHIGVGRISTSALSATTYVQVAAAETRSSLHSIRTSRSTPGSNVGTKHMEKHPLRSHLSRLG